MKIALAGDVMLGRLVNEKLKRCDSSYPWGDTLPLFKSADLRICNLECVLSNVGNPWSVTPKMFHFRSDEKNVDALLEAQIDLVSIANNHVLDYEDEALLRMLNVLDAHRILHTGAGRNFTEACQPAICEVADQTVGMIAFTDNEPDWEAQENRAGVFYVPTNANDARNQGLLKRVASLRKKVDFLIVSAHWGPNWGYEVPADHKFLAHALIDAGADLIFGHSGHIYRGIEVYKERLIVYCGGDFIDDYAVDEVERNDESFLFIIEKESGKTKLCLYPTHISQFQANLTRGHRQKAQLSKMGSLCSDLGTTLECFPDHAEITTKL